MEDLTDARTEIGRANDKVGAARIPFREIHSLANRA